MENKEVVDALTVLAQAKLALAEEVKAMREMLAPALEAWKGSLQAQERFFEWQLKAQSGVMRRSGVSAERPEIVTPDLPGATTGQEYEAAIEFKHNPYEVEVDGLPPGLVYKDGKVSGVPASPGEYKVTVNAKSDFGFRDRTFDLKVAKGEPVADAEGSGNGPS